MKKLLMLSVALCGASAIYAADVTNPFYVAGEGKFLSDTSATYQNFDHGWTKSLLATETVSYGVAKGAAVAVKVADSWFFNWGSGHEKYDNPAFGISAKYNIVDDAAKVQVEAGYEQGIFTDETASFAIAGDHHVKNIYGTVKAGYDLGDGFLPYASLTVSKFIGKYNEDPVYTGRIALAKTFNEHFTSDAGISYIYNSEKNWAGKRIKTWTADASVNYLFNESTSIGLKAEYLINKTPRWLKYDAYTIGANFKIAF